MTLSIPSAARYLSLKIAEDSPPVAAQLIPIIPERDTGIGVFSFFMTPSREKYTSLIETTTSTLLFLPAKPLLT